MSERELVMHMIDALPEDRLGYVIGYIQGLSVQEAADDAFCERLYQAYLNDPDPEKNEGTPLDECKREWGIV